MICTSIPAPQYGNSPSSGGFFKKEILDQIKEVVVGNRVILIDDGRIQVLDIRYQTTWKHFFEGYH